MLPKISRGGLIFYAPPCILLSELAQSSSTAVHMRANTQRTHHGTYILNHDSVPWAVTIEIAS